MQNQCEIDLGNQCWSTITASTSEDLRAHKVTHEDVHTLLSCIMSVSCARSAWTHMMSISQGHLLSDHSKKTMRERVSLSHAYTHVHGTHARTHIPRYTIPQSESFLNQFKLDSLLRSSSSVIPFIYSQTKT